MDGESVCLSVRPLPTPNVGYYSIIIDTSKKYKLKFQLWDMWVCVYIKVTGFEASLRTNTTF